METGGGSHAAAFMSKQSTDNKCVSKTHTDDLERPLTPFFDAENFRNRTRYSTDIVSMEY